LGRSTEKRKRVSSSGGGRVQQDNLGGQTGRGPITYRKWGHGSGVDGGQSVWNFPAKAPDMQQLGMSRLDK